MAATVRSLLSLRRSLSQSHSRCPPKLIVEGRAHVAHILALQRQRQTRWSLDSLVLTPDTHARELKRHSGSLTQALDACQVTELADAKFDRLSATQSVAGYLAVFNTNTNDSESSSHSCIMQPSNGVNTLIVDGVSDPGNLGSLIRSALAFHFANLLLVGCCSPFTAKTIAASAGTIASKDLRLRLYSDCQRGALIDAVQSQPNRPIIASLVASGGSVFESSRSSPISGSERSSIALIVGNESRGIGADLLAVSNSQLTIPMAPTVESLNVACAASIAMAVIGSSQHR